VPPERAAAREDEIVQATGLTARFPYGAIRLAALCEASPEIARGLTDGRLVAGPLGAFLVARLADGDAAACDPSLAQRTLAWDIRGGGWSPSLAEATGIPPSWWPEVAPSFGARGRLRFGRTRVALRALAGDVGAAVRGVADDDAPEHGVLVLGTGGFMVAPAGRMPRHVEGLLTTVLYEDADGPLYAVEGTVHGLAAAVVEAGRRGGWEGLAVERIAARAGSATASPRVNAAPEGTGTPEWDVEPRFDVERGRFRPEDVVRGTLEDLARRFGRIAHLLRDGGVPIDRFVATGGLAAAPHLTAMISREIEMQVAIDPRPHRTAAGIALLARDGR
jgi:glycerol kinase